LVSEQRASFIPYTTLTGSRKLDGECLQHGTDWIIVRNTDTFRLECAKL